MNPTNRLILGKRKSGKTIYLTTMWKKLPNSILVIPAMQYNNYRGYYKGYEHRLLTIPPFSLETSLQICYKRKNVILMIDEAQLEIDNPDEYARQIGWLRNVGVGVWRTAHRPSVFITRTERSVIDEMVLFRLELKADKELIKREYDFDATVLDALPEYWYALYRSGEGWRIHRPII